MSKISKLTIHSKLPRVGTTIFTVMSALASEHKAINLGQGYPDYPMSEELIALVNEAMKKGYNQYMPMEGYIRLREVLAEKVQFLYAAKVDPEQSITITPGGTYAIYTAMTTILRPGDEVIVFEPAYDSYIPGIELNGAIPVLIDLEFPGFNINWKKVKEQVSPKTRMILLNSPNNPTGAVLSAADMVELHSIVRDTNILILSDEVYEHLIFDGMAHQSILRYPDLMERSFVCFSFGKVYHCTGWKLGYCISSPLLMKEFRKVHQFNCFSCNSPMQVALSHFLTNKDSYLSLGSMMQEKRDYFEHLMQQTPFTPFPSHGSYFQLYGYDQLSDEADKDFAIRLTQENQVAVIPVSAFYQSGTDRRLVRFCFAKKRKTLEQAAERLSNITS